MTTEPAVLVGDPTGDDHPEPPPGDGPRDTRRADRLAASAYLLLALFVTARLWMHPTGVMLRDNRQDNIQFEWFLTNSVYTLRHLGNPFFTDLINAPIGVNLMANTSVWGLALPVAPVTALFGARVAFRVLETAALFGTALAWYFALSRRVVRTRAAAFVGGLFCGFAPGMLGQDTGHPNVAGQFVLPFILLAVLRLTDGNGRRVRNGLLLGALVVYQIFINEEILLLFALALGVFVVGYWVQRPDVINRCLPDALVSCAVAAGLVVAVAGYPVYLQFFGRQSYRGLPGWVLDYSTDLRSYVAYAQQSLAGTKAGAQPLAQGVSEQNSFYGWGLAVLLVAAVAWLWRRPVARAVALSGLVFLLLSLGRYVIVGGHTTSVPGPWRLLSRLPLLDTVVPTRLSLMVIPAAGVLLALCADRILAEGVPSLRIVGFAALAAALLPLAPRPLPVQGRAEAPRFFGTGEWRSVLPAGSTVGLMPFGWGSDLDMSQWQTEQGLRFKILNGYFLGPDPADPGRGGQFGGGRYLVRAVLGDGAVDQPITPDQRRYCLAELRSWHTTALVLPGGEDNADALRANADRLLGPGRRVADVWVWRVPAA